MNCPTCSEAGGIVKWKRDGYRRFECQNGHRWTVGKKRRGWVIGRKWTTARRDASDVRSLRTRLCRSGMGRSFVLIALSITANA
jgi:hypothetical protein